MSTATNRQWKMTEKPGPRDGWYEISPAQAQFLLERGARNRPLKEVRAQRIAAEIQAGTWRPNGETIIFDDKGRCVDGQHRLRGCVLADKSIKAYCVFDIPARFFPSFDQGVSRGGSDTAALMGFSNYNTVAAVARLAIQYADGSIDKSQACSNDRLRLYMERNREKLTTAVSVVVRLRKGLMKLVPPSYPAFLYYVAAETQPFRALDFVEKLASGEGLKRGDGLLLFRQRMTELIGDKHAVRPNHKLALLVKAWNAYVQDKPIGTLKWNSEVELFPRITLGADDIAQEN